MKLLIRENDPTSSDLVDDALEESSVLRDFDFVADDGSDKCLAQHGTSYFDEPICSVSSMECMHEINNDRDVTYGSACSSPWLSSFSS